MPTKPQRPPLGLPAGSVRALLTFLIVAVTINELLRGRIVETLWTETLLIALAHYFTTRRFIQFPEDVLRKLEDDGFFPKESRPLGLPRWFVQCLIILVFAWATWQLYATDQLFGHPSVVAVLGMVVAFLGGVLVKEIVSWFHESEDHVIQQQGLFRLVRIRPKRWIEDLKAVAVLVLLAATAGCYLADRPDLVPQHLRTTAVALVLFYFGSR